MSNKNNKKPNRGPQSKQPAKQSGKQAGESGNRNKLIVGGVIAAILVGLLFVIVSNGSKSASASAGGGTTNAPSGTPAQEAKYLGRLLPAGYQEPQVAKTTIYTSTTTAKQVQASDSGSTLSVPLDQITSNKIVRFDYAKAGSGALPLIAYIKPSGKLFVGVSFCPPCQGKGQRIEPDMTLTCDTCGTKRQLETQIGVSGACKLYPLDEVPSKVVGGKLVIDKSVLDGWTAQPLDRPTGG
jgi:hypothetical protein